MYEIDDDYDNKSELGENSGISLIEYFFNIYNISKYRKKASFKKAKTKLNSADKLIHDDGYFTIKFQTIDKIRRSVTFYTQIKSEECQKSLKFKLTCEQVSHFHDLGIKNHGVVWLAPQLKKDDQKVYYKILNIDDYIEIIKGGEIVIDSEDNFYNTESVSIFVNKLLNSWKFSRRVSDELTISQSILYRVIKNEENIPIIKETILTSSNTKEIEKTENLYNKIISISKNSSKKNELYLELESSTEIISKLSLVTITSINDTIILNNIKKLIIPKLLEIIRSNTFNSVEELGIVHMSVLNLLRHLKQNKLKITKPLATLIESAKTIDQGFYSSLLYLIEDEESLPQYYFTDKIIFKIFDRINYDHLKGRYASLLIKHFDKLNGKIKLIYEYIENSPIAGKSNINNGVYYYFNALNDRIEANPVQDKKFEDVLINTLIKWADENEFKMLEIERKSVKYRYSWFPSRFLSFELHRNEINPFNLLWKYVNNLTLEDKNTLFQRIVNLDELNESLLFFVFFYTYKNQIQNDWFLNILKKIGIDYDNKWIPINHNIRDINPVEEWINPDNRRINYLKWSLKDWNIELEYYEEYGDFNRPPWEYSQRIVEWLNENPNYLEEFTYKIFSYDFKDIKNKYIYQSGILTHLFEHSTLSPIEKLEFVRKNFEPTQLKDYPPLQIFRYINKNIDIIDDKDLFTQYISKFLNNYIIEEKYIKHNYQDVRSFKNPINDSMVINTSIGVALITLFKLNYNDLENIYPLLKELFKTNAPYYKEIIMYCFDREIKSEDRLKHKKFVTGLVKDYLNEGGISLIYVLRVIRIYEIHIKEIQSKINIEVNNFLTNYVHDDKDRYDNFIINEICLLNIFKCWFFNEIINVVETVVNKELLYTIVNFYIRNADYLRVGEKNHTKKWYKNLESILSFILENDLNNNENQLRNIYYSNFIPSKISDSNNYNEIKAYFKYWINKPIFNKAVEYMHGDINYREPNYLKIQFISKDLTYRKYILEFIKVIALSISVKGMKSMFTLVYLTNALVEIYKIESNNEKICDTIYEIVNIFLESRYINDDLVYLSNKLC